MASKTNDASTVPAGYHSVTPYLVVDGASRLIEFLKFTFEAELRDSFTDKEGKVQHAEVRVGDSVVMLTDASTVGFSPIPSQLYVYVTDVDEVFKRGLKAGGSTVRDPENKVYGDRTAAIKDPTGNIWWIATHLEEVTHEETEKRMQA
jgi:PhnB protein